MAVANFFSRASVAAAHVLDGFDDSAFVKRVSRCTAAVAFDANAASTSEGVAALELSIDLFARFYPTLAIIALDGDPLTTALQLKLRSLAHKINPVIDLDGKLRKAACCLVLGRTGLAGDVPRVFVGSEGWTAKLSLQSPVGSADTRNPFGAAFAACLGVANVFRKVFADQLPHGGTDDEIELDVLHYSHESSSTGVALPDVIDIGETHLVGVGAIGRAAVWGLARTGGLTGRLHLIDSETIELSNLQRYVGTISKSVNKIKVKSAAALLADRPGLSVVPHYKRWGEYLRERANCNLETIAVALDSAADRVAVQASLPRRIVNAWTQPGDLGVSRHGFVAGPCLMCLYLPTGKVPNESDLVARALRLPEPEIRTLLHIGATVDGSLVQRISDAAGVPLGDLVGFVGLPLRVFYSKAVCGTTVFGSPDGGERGAMAVPMAFQSALAGVLLAAELIENTLKLRRSVVPPVSKINLMRPLGRLLNEPAAKHSSGRCICQDPVYVDAYTRKFSAAH